MKPTRIHPTAPITVLSEQDLDQIVGGSTGLATGKRRHEPFTLIKASNQQQTAGKEAHYYTIDLQNATT